MATIIIPVAAGTVVFFGRYPVTLRSAANFEFAVDSLDSVAEIIAASDGGNRENPLSSITNLSLNAAALAHTIVAGGRAQVAVTQEEKDALQGFPAGTPIDVTYGANGVRKFAASPGNNPSYYYYY